MKLPPTQYNTPPGNTYLYLGCGRCVQSLTVAFYPLSCRRYDYHDVYSSVPFKPLNFTDKSTKGCRSLNLFDGSAKQMRHT